MNPIYALVVALALLPALAAASEPVPLLSLPPGPSDSLSNEQVQGLIGALRVLDSGSPDQCPIAKDGAKDDKKAPERACPYHKSAGLIRAMARDIVMLDPLDHQFKIAQNAIRLEILAGEKSPQQQEAEFTQRLLKLYAERQPMPALEHVKMADLDLGAAPEHNQMPAVVVAGLAPIIDDFQK